MYTVNAGALSVSLDVSAARIASLKLCGSERLGGVAPLFCLCLRNRKGDAFYLRAEDASVRRERADGVCFAEFSSPLGNPLNMEVNVRLVLENGALAWRIEVEQREPELLLEWVDFPLVTLPALEKNNESGTGGSILFPYNEGVLVKDWEARKSSWFPHEEAEYPSKGAFAVFPNMISSQMLSYHWKDAGIYMGAHDAARGVKGIDFYASGNGITMQMRLWCGVGFGESYRPDFPIVWRAVSPRWESAAQCYRTWNDAHLPVRAKKIKENKNLPAWYEDAPLMIAYPVRGLHDTDKMIPNHMYPYVNVLPTVRELNRLTGGRVMVLLMHWEGTAPWAPPYVWPPYGGEEGFFALRDELHKEGNLLGVYCSGFGYTLESNLIEGYNKEAEYEARGLERGMCAGPDGKVAISRICTAQRRGVDICPASPVGRALLRKAYTPLFESGADYAQILDQNHGGGQYFCYSDNHGHPPAPGAWMTREMQGMLGEWNEQAPNMLFGCESAAAEPFIGNLLFSDNRFELNYFFGTPVPLYSYLYHEYLRNFMGNQVCSPFDETEDAALWYRIAYAFSCGDSMTLVLDQDGNPKSRWGELRTSYIPDREKVLRLASNLSRLYREGAKEYLFCGRMAEGVDVECERVTLHKALVAGECELPAVVSSFWEREDGGKACLLVNPSEQEKTVRIGEKMISVPALDGVLCKL